MGKKDFEGYGLLSEDIGETDHHEGFRVYAKDCCLSISRWGPCLRKGKEFFVHSPDYEDFFVGDEDEIIWLFNKTHWPPETAYEPHMQIKYLQELPDDYEVEDQHLDCSDSDVIEIKFDGYEIMGVETGGKFHWYYPEHKGGEVTNKAKIAGAMFILETLMPNSKQLKLDKFL